MVTEEDVSYNIDTLINYLVKTYGKETLTHCGLHGEQGLSTLENEIRKVLLNRHEMNMLKSDPNLPPKRDIITAKDVEETKYKIERLVRHGCGIEQHHIKLPARTYQRGTYSEKPSTDIIMEMPKYVNLQRMANEKDPLPSKLLTPKYTLPSGQIQTKSVPKWLYAQMRTKADEYAKKMRHYKKLKEQQKFSKT